MKKKNLLILALVLIILSLSFSSKGFPAEPDDHSEKIASEFTWGNIVLDNKLKEMNEAKVNLVVYPHWIHRLWFKCKTCHYELEIDKKGGNDITMEKINKGEICGKCHNGKLSFGKDECNRCHSLKVEEQTLEGHLYTTKNILSEKYTQKLKEIAAIYGAEWNPEKLETEDFPRDKFGFIKWINLLELGVINPIHSLDPNEKDEIKENEILFKVLSDFVDDVLWSHKIHTTWIKCEQCHEAKGNKSVLFKPVLGANKIRMKQMVAEQNLCAHCHGKVSFPIADCVRCHNYPKDYKFGDEVLKRIELNN